MNTKQNIEALTYFKKNAEDWRRKAKIDANIEINVIKQRNDFVLKVAKERKENNLLLDVGCGTGELVCDLAEVGKNVVGVDFAREMIDFAKRTSQENGLKNVIFECCSIFDYNPNNIKFDLISANGFIEYISYDELNEFFKFSIESLNTGGSLVLGSRNRLFNIFSLNKFTMDEMKENEINLLISEAINLTNCDGLESLEGLETASLQKSNMKHSNTGIEVDTRYQFTPVQLIKMAKEFGFKTVELYPIHIHGVNPYFKEKYQEVHWSISNLLQNYPYSSVNLIPQSSSFMIHLNKP